MGPGLAAHAAPREWVLVETAELNQVEQENRDDEDADGDERSHEKPQKLNLLPRP